MEAFKVNEIIPADVLVFLKTRFEKTGEDRDASNKTQRVDKHSSGFNALMKKIPIRTFDALYKQIPELLETHYKTPSTRQSILSMLRIVCVEHAGFDSAAWTKKYGKLNMDLRDQYIQTTDRKEVGMSFKEAKAIETENDTLALYFKIFGGDMAVMRFGDWINASTIDDGKSNYINLKKKNMSRRITKNGKGEMVIKIPKVIIDEIKKQKINGYLFGGLTEPQISLMVKKAYPGINATSRHFRNLYSTEKISKMKSVPKIKEALKIMDHSLSTWLNIYQRIDKPIFRLLKDEGAQ